MDYYINHRLLISLVFLIVPFVNGCKSVSTDPDVNQSYSGIFFAADKDVLNSNELYVTREGETEPGKLSVFPQSNYFLTVESFKLSPDKKWLAYVVMSTVSASELYVVPASGGVPVYVAGSALGAVATNITNYDWSPTSQYLAYTEYSVAEGTNLFLVNSDGSGNVKVSVDITPASPYSPYILGVQRLRWSPDGLSVAYASTVETPSQTHLYVVDSAGNNVRLTQDITVNAGGVYEFAWSPDSSDISIVANYGAGTELYAVRRDGSQSRQLTSMTPDDALQAVHVWSPDGAYIAYTSFNTTNGPVLFTIKRDGTERINVSVPPLPGTGGILFYWSPTDNLIAYETRTELFVVNPDGSQRYMLTSLMEPSGVVNNFAWSPDGSHVAYTRFQGTSNLLELYAVKSDGTGLNKVAGAESITDFGDALMFKWSPDSLHLGVVAREQGGGASRLYSVTAYGADLVPISPEFAAGVYVVDFAWSSDSKYLTYVANQDVDNQFMLYRTDVDGFINSNVSGSFFAGHAVKQFVYSN